MEMETSSLIRHKTGLYYREGTLEDAVFSDQSAYSSLDIKSSDVVLDVGAHIGAFANFARVADRIFCYEAEFSNYELLCHNIAVIGFHQVVAQHAAVVNSDYQHSQVMLFLGKTRRTTSSSLLPIKGRISIPVPAAKFSDILSQCAPNVIKIDIEGGEYCLLPELLWLPDFVRELAIEFHFSRKAWREMAEVFVRDLESRGFRAKRSFAPSSRAWHTVAVWAR